MRTARLAGLTGPGVFSISFALYLATLAPSITFWDSGELVYGAFSLGLPHPPAYPLFCMIGRAFSFIPVGSVAYRVNLLSAVFGAASVYLLYRMIVRLGEAVPAREALAATVALCFASYRPFWGVAVVTEVYTLNTFLLLVTALFLLEYDKGRRDAHLYASAFFLGLALVNHQSTVLFLPLYAVYCFLTNHTYRRPAVLAQSLFFFILAYSTVMYLPVRAGASPPLDIGGPRTIHWFFWVMKWGEYAENLRGIIGNFEGIVGGAAIAAAALAMSALVVYAMRKSGFLLLLAFSAISYFAGIRALTYGAAGILKWGLQTKFYIPAVVFLVLAASAAAFAMTGSARNKRAVRAGVIAASAVALGFSLYQAAGNLKECDNGRDFFACDLAGNVLKSARQDGAIFAWGDNGVFPVWYLQGVERYRDDVLFVHTEILTYPWYMEDVQKWLVDRYGLSYEPPALLGDLVTNVSALSGPLANRTPTYYDYSAAAQLGLKLENFKPQGLLYLAPDWRASTEMDVWGRYVMRGAFDGSTNKAFATEGIMDIYAWDAYIWAQNAYKEGRPGESVKAYELAKALGLKNDSIDRWMDGVKKNMRSDAPG